MSIRTTLSTWFSNLLHRFHKRVNPSQLILLSFLAVIATGTFLLSLPISSASGTSAGFVTPLFTTTSAVCVTGLVVVETATFWSPFGQVVILALIQVGGLGLISMLMLILILSGQKVTLRDRVIIQTAMNQDNLAGMIRLIKTAVFGTFAVEGVAAVILTIRFALIPGISFPRALSYGIFHAISAFCNAGFDILGSSSIMPYVGDPTINLVIMGLIIIGGLGFSVWSDLIRTFKNLKKRANRNIITYLRTLTLHTKLVLSVTGVLLFGGALFFFLSEGNNPETMGALSLGEKIWASFFQSTTLRTAGYFSIPQGGLDEASKFMSVILMAIGGSPAATAGGMKTVTVGVLFFSIISAFKGKEHTQAFGRKISTNIILKALTIVGMFITIAFAATIILTFTERAGGYPYDFMDLLFEVTSATATVGLTTGITPSLTVPGKLVICVCMFLGRTGPLTMVLALNRKQQNRQDRLEYPEENVLIG